jgi:hypothetical protein
VKLSATDALSAAFPNDEPQQEHVRALLFERDTDLLPLVAGFTWYADPRRRRAPASAHARAGLFLGLGGFQLFDGTVGHKLLRLHQIRYGVDALRSGLERRRADPARPTATASPSPRQSRHPSSPKPKPI